MCDFSSVHLRASACMCVCLRVGGAHTCVGVRGGQGGHPPQHLTLVPNIPPTERSQGSWEKGPLLGPEWQQ